LKRLRKTLETTATEAVVKVAPGTKNETKKAKKRIKK